MMPPISEMSLEERAGAFDHVVRTTWKGLAVETTWIHDESFSAVLLMPGIFGDPMTQPRILRAVAALAESEADGLDAAGRGMRQTVDPAAAAILLLDAEAATPLEDTLMRVGLNAVMFREPTALAIFSGAIPITPSLLRGFARLLKEQAYKIEHAFPPREAPPAHFTLPGVSRTPAWSGDSPTAVPPALAEVYGEAPPANGGYVYSTPTPLPPGASWAAPEPAPAPRASVPVPIPEPPPPSERSPRGLDRVPGPLSMGVPGAGGMPARVPDPIDPAQRAPTRRAPRAGR